jgi:hypothetical protein
MTTPIRCPLWIWAATEDSETADQSPDSIAAALQELLMGINSKIPPMEIMMIVNTKVHPNFITAFGLQFG